MYPVSFKNACPYDGRRNLSENRLPQNDKNIQKTTSLLQPFPVLGTPAMTPTTWHRDCSTCVASNQRYRSGSPLPPPPPRADRHVLGTRLPDVKPMPKLRSAFLPSGGFRACNLVRTDTELLETLDLLTATSHSACVTLAAKHLLACSSSCATRSYSLKRLDRQIVDDHPNLHGGTRSAHLATAPPPAAGRKWWRKHTLV